MEHKSWRWERKVSEKTTVAHGRVSIAPETYMEEDRETEVGLRKCPSNLEDRVVSVVCDCNAKEELIGKHTRTAEQAVAGQEIGGAEATHLKQELDKTLHAGVQGERIIQNAFSKATMDFEKEKNKLEAKLAEAKERISNLSAENTNLMNALLCKEKLVQDLDEQKAELESEFSVLKGRFDSAERENAFLVERVHDMEEKSKTLRVLLSLSDSELQCWRIKYDQMASKLAEVEAQLKEASEGENSMQSAISGFDLSDSDGISDSEEELEQFRPGKIKNQPKCKPITAGTTPQVSGNEFQSTSKKLVPIPVGNSSYREKDELYRRRNSWLDEILKVILEEHRVSKRNFGDLLQEIKIVLGCDDLQKSDDSNSGVSGFLTWESSNSTYTENPTVRGISSNNISMEEEKGHMEDASFVRRKIKKHFGFDRSKCENRMEVDAQNRHNTLAQMIANQLTMKEENRRIKEKLQGETEENATLRSQIEESKQNIQALHRELDALKESKGLIEEQMENQRSFNEDLDTQLTVAKAKVNGILQKLSSLEIELEDKNNYCEELEATCLELQLQLETVSTNRSPDTDTDQVAKKFRTEAIQNPGKQLKALASPNALLFDSINMSPTTTITVQKSTPISNKKSLAAQRSSLRDRMLEEDYDHDDDDLEKPSVNLADLRALPAPELKVRAPEPVGSLALVPSKKPGGGGFGFIRNLFLRRKRGCTKMKTSPLQKTSALMRQKDVLLVR